MTSGRLIILLWMDSPLFCLFCAVFLRILTSRGTERDANDFYIARVKYSFGLHSSHSFIRLFWRWDYVKDERYVEKIYSAKFDNSLSFPKALIWDNRR